MWWRTSASGTPVAGERVRAAIMRTLATLAALAPRTDGREATLDTGERCRRCFVAPVVIFYQRALGMVAVLHVWHHARAPVAR
jgi:plasmid stabilization system protein ParE